VIWEGNREKINVLLQLGIEFVMTGQREVFWVHSPGRQCAKNRIMYNLGTGFS
jgi:hypothetical protein